MIDKKSLVIVYLNEPREKYWGRLQELAPVGVYLRGLALPAAEDWAREIASGQEGAMGPMDLFFPLHRVEKIFLDEVTGTVQSVHGKFREIVGFSAEEFL